MRNGSVGVTTLGRDKSGETGTRFEDEMTALLSPAEAAQRLHLSERTLRDLKRRGLIRYVALTERKVFYRPEDCDEYVAARVRVDEPCESNPRPKARPRPGGATGKIIPFSQRARG